MCLGNSSEGPNVLTDLQNSSCFFFVVFVVVGVVVIVIIIIIIILVVFPIKQNDKKPVANRQLMKVFSDLYPINRSAI